ncbi:MAG: hypothetical protein JWP12_2101 [Bacteroidetes bacterium]|nr:hypothetical protein [Bacteroidota bacterium]
MKKYLFFLFLFSMMIITGNTFAQVPEKIYGKNRVLKPNEYYLEQMELWKKEVDKDPKNADAWYNYYRANRNAYIKGQEKNTLDAKGVSRFDRLQNIVQEMEKNVPDSYEYNFVKWLNGNNDASLFPFLEKAHQLSPKSSEPIMSLVFYYEITGDYVQRDKSIAGFYNIGDYSPGLLNYSYNMLAGLEKDAIVFTEGDKDTEATFILEKGYGVRDDVRLLNVNLLLIADYRERIFKELGIPPLDFDPMTNDANFEKFRQTIIEQVAKNKNGRPVYAAVTVSAPYTAAIKEKLYLTGLASLFSNTKINATATLIKNVENVYLLDYLKEYFPKDISWGNVHSMNGNYLLPFAALSRYYELSGDATKAADYKERARKVAADADRLTDFETIFNAK